MPINPEKRVESNVMSAAESLNLPPRKDNVDPSIAVSSVQIKTDIVGDEGSQIAGAYKSDAVPSIAEPTPVAVRKKKTKHTEERIFLHRRWGYPLSSESEDDETEIAIQSVAPPAPPDSSSKVVARDSRLPKRPADEPLDESASSKRLRS